jgi:hypothetical protein
MVVSKLFKHPLKPLKKTQAATQVGADAAARRQLLRRLQHSGKKNYQQKRDRQKRGRQTVGNYLIQQSA